MAALSIGGGINGRRALATGTSGTEVVLKERLNICTLGEADEAWPGDCDISVASRLLNITCGSCAANAGVANAGAGA